MTKLMLDAYGYCCPSVQLSTGFGFHMNYTIYADWSYNMDGITWNGIEIIPKHDFALS